MTLKSLDEFNAARYEQWTKLNDNSPRLNGVACPQCGAELVDSCPNMTLSSNPPQKNVACLKCEYRGYRVA